MKNLLIASTATLFAALLLSSETSSRTLMVQAAEQQQAKHSCAHGTLTTDPETGKPRAIQTTDLNQHGGTGLEFPHLWRHEQQDHAEMRRKEFSVNSATNAREFKEQAAVGGGTWPPQGWHGLRIVVDYTYSDTAADDKYPSSQGSKPRACTAENQEIEIGGAAKEGAYCLDLNANDHCRVKCREEDVVTTARIAKLKEVTQEAVDTFAQMLAVPDRVPDQVLQTDPARQCGNVDVPVKNVTGADFILFATLRPLQHLGGTVAYALTCNIDSNTGRPYMGHMNVAPDTLAKNDDLVTVLLHELAHALGFSPVMYNYFRHPSDRTKTYLEYNSQTYPTGPFKGGGISQVAGKPNEFSIDYKLLEVKATGAAPRLKWIGPNTISYAKSYFGCNTIDGVEWENGGRSDVNTVQSSSTGTHWEKRILYYETMTANQNLVRGLFTKFTTMFFQDTGFYEVNATFGDSMDYGQGEGCNWVNDCSLWSDSYSCKEYKTNSFNGGGECGYDRRFTGYCNLQRWNADVPEAYQHYTDKADGGEDYFSDQCAYTVPFGRNGNGVGPCYDPSNYPISDNYRGVWTGANSRCYKSRVADNNRLNADERALCFQTACVGNQVNVRIKEDWYPCLHDNHQFQLVTPERPTTVDYTEDDAPPKPLPTDVVQSTWYYSFGMKGVFSCGSELAKMCASDTMVKVTTWPNITRLEPSEDIYEGGALITLYGESLDECSTVRIGGNVVTNVTKVSSTMMTFNAPPVGSEKTNGGLYNADGLGPAMVELLCSSSAGLSSCPLEGCVHARLMDAFNYTEKEVTPFSASNWLKNFIATPIGKVVGGAIGFIILILLIVIVKSVCEGGEDGKKKQQRQAQQKRAAQPPVGRTVLAPMAAGGAGAGMAYGRQPQYQPQRRMDEYEEDLL